MTNEANLTMFKMGIKKSGPIINTKRAISIGSTTCDFCSYQNNPEAHRHNDYEFRIFKTISSGWTICSHCVRSHL
jgi:hypothetical protein